MGRLSNARRCYSNFPACPFSIVNIELPVTKHDDKETHKKESVSPSESARFTSLAARHQ